MNNPTAIIATTTAVISNPASATAATATTHATTTTTLLPQPTTTHVTSTTADSIEWKLCHLWTNQWHRSKLMKMTLPKHIRPWVKRSSSKKPQIPQGMEHVYAELQPKKGRLRKLASKHLATWKEFILHNNGLEANKDIDLGPRHRGMAVLMRRFQHQDPDTGILYRPHKQPSPELCYDLGYQSKIRKIADGIVESSLAEKEARRTTRYPSPLRQSWTAEDLAEEAEEVKQQVQQEVQETVTAVAVVSASRRLPKFEVSISSTSTSTKRGEKKKEKKETKKPTKKKPTKNEEKEPTKNKPNTNKKNCAVVKKVVEVVRRVTRSVATVLEAPRRSGRLASKN